MTSEVDMARSGAQRGDVDAIVIGSGMGGLTAAALLARVAGKRVLVLERHWRAGGFTHTFDRPGGFRWDVGVHYVGDLGTGLERAVFDVATGAGVRWVPMADPFERLHFPGFSFDVRRGRATFEADLCRAFPEEAAGIRAYLADVDRAAGLLQVTGARALAPAPIARAIELVRRGTMRAGLRTSREAIERRVRAPALRAVLGARWGDHGLPPGQSAFAAHATITAHYYGGGFYPEGSAAVLAERARAVIEAAGGEVRVRADVAGIVVRGGRAVGVRLAGGEEIAAPLVISDAGARATYLRLLSPDVPLPFREELRAIPPGLGHVNLYLGLSRSPAELGVRGENLWLHDALDHDDMAARGGAVLEGRAPNLYVSFPSLKDPAARAHTAELIAPVPGAAFAPWAGTAWKRRGPDYEALKARIAEGMLAQAEARLPGLRSLIVHQELSTPLSTEAFTGHAGGEIYGLPADPARFRRRWLGARTPVPGLFLAGADAMMLGIVGAMMGGAMAAAAATSPRLLGQVRAAARALTPAGTPPRPAASSPSSA